MNDHHQPLPPESLYKASDPAEFDFTSTDELADVGVVIGQERALEAIRFGLGIARKGYNIFALGPAGAGKAIAVQEIVRREAQNRPVPDDWAYVHDFAEPSRPRALRLPAGQGRRFAEDMEQLIEELGTAIPGAFEGEEYRARAEEIEEDAKEREQTAIHELRLEARRHSIALIETPTGFAFAPVDAKNEVLSPAEFEQLTEERQREIQDNIAQYRQQLQKLLRQFPTWRRDSRQKLKNLNREMAGFAVSHPLDEIKTRYAAIPDVVRHLDAVEKELVDHADEFLPKSEGGLAAMLGQGQRPTNPLARYRANLVIDHADSEYAPIESDCLPTHANLIGRVEYQAFMGALLTDFTMIKAGALHRANGGYLILDARKILTQPYAWETLKRTLMAGEIRIESLEHNLGLISTSTLEPMPIPLDVKIILIGDRMLYYLLDFYDPEFRELFKVCADFEDTLDRDTDGNALYARLIASLARRDGLKALDRDAVLRIVEHASRQVEDSAKLSTHLRGLADLLKEADHWAAQQDRTLISRDDVQTAIDQQIHRVSRLRERVYEQIQRGTVFIETDGAAVGQINGLSVISLGEHAFGQPSRITATTRLGSGKIVDIEREAELGGAIHSKGVMILSSFLAARYARAEPLSLAASLVFEQSYGPVDGDSASLAELCAILSSLSEVPIGQFWAVTGSVNQHGRVQPIGGVNEKIEGFFDVCRARGLTGRQGVIIPGANVKHLMLRHNVIAAATEGSFRIHAVESVDQALELLTGQAAGQRDGEGQFPADSVNGRVERKLREWTEARKKLAQPANEPGKNDHE